MLFLMLMLLMMMIMKMLMIPFPFHRLLDWEDYLLFFLLGVRGHEKSYRSLWQGHTPALGRHEAFTL